MTRIVVVGNGMAGARFVQELRARDSGQRFRVTVLGAEPDAAYNRVLLSSVLAGSLSPEQAETVPSAWYAAEDVELRTGVEVARIDRRRRRVLTTAGEHVDYDHLVLATGSRAWVPPLPGLVGDDGELDPDVAVFRTMRDCRDILARIAGVRRAVVLGGGLLGLEAARGLAGRGVDVEVVHAADRLMERQLDLDAGRVLARTLRALGVRVRVGAQALAYEDGPDGRVLRLDDGDGTLDVPADLLVVACGVRPNAALARAAGVGVDRAVVVDDRLATSDPRIHAIGECAQHAGQVYGLVAPAWEQATVLADVIAGGPARYGGSRIVTRLKAADVDLAAMGDTNVDDLDDELEVLRFADPVRGTYQKVIIRGDRVTGAIMLGGPETVGTVTQLFDRASPVPPDRRTLIFPGVRDAGAGGAGGTAEPAELPDEHTVCRCNGVSCGQIRAAAADGAGTVADVATTTRATTGCGGCRGDVAAVLAAATQSTPTVEVPA
ncbi:assimilatory nitrate reductase electron transfer subunit [Haloactinopolyspora alba]|uniref:Assimilatory nitrate reductase electron transfer subunit n=1 Tax=Haloactinopolyspora alba TaxID=648780 RepID=A0A2P8EFR7_9ACTN|nr:FAD-dependent oxidoreductase [Haloactinopolyspora alba]PSL08315.1 assimilatory nitrate reductase electron transfer subunit [Haloactinopolyspora alba]